MAAVIRHISGIPVEEWRRVQVPEGWRAELIGGECVVHPAPTWGHAVIATRLADALRTGVPASFVVSTSSVEWEIGGAVLTGAPRRRADRRADQSSTASGCGAAARRNCLTAEPSGQALRVVDRASGEGVLTSERPFPYSIRPADLVP